MEISRQARATVPGLAYRLWRTGFGVQALAYRLWRAGLANYGIMNYQKVPVRVCPDGVMIASFGETHG
jgi:hypothetical protein